MIRRDWHDRQPRFQPGVDQWLAQVRRGAKLATMIFEIVPHKLLYDRQVERQSCRRDFSTTPLDKL